MKKDLVGIHWNSHKKCWSVVNFKSRKTVGLLKDHMSELLLSDISFKVDLSKKRKALEKGSKDRHTFIVGSLEEFGEYGTISPIKYQKEDNIHPFKDIEGNEIVGRSLYFSKDGKVFLLEN